MSSNVRQLLENGVPIYPITEKSLVIGLQDAPFESYIVAWDGTAAPTVANVPAGVVINYSGTDYTGTLAASSSTAPYLYLVASTSQQGEYDRYITTRSGSSFVWTALGSTAPVSPVIADDLVTNDSSKALSAKQGKILNDNLGQLDQKVNNLNIYDSPVFSKLGRIIASTGEVVFNDTSYIIRAYAVTPGVYVNFNIYSFSSGYVNFAFYDGTGFLEANCLYKENGTGWGARIVKEMTVPVGAKCLVLLCRDGQTANNTLTIRMNGKDYSALFHDLSVSFEKPYAQFVDDNIVKPSTVFKNCLFNADGSIYLTEAERYVNTYDVAGAKKILIKNVVGSSADQRKIAFYSSYVVSSASFLSMITGRASGDILDGIYSVPATAKMVAIMYPSDAPVVYSDIHLSKASDSLDNITEQNFLCKLTSRYVNATGGVQSSTYANIKVYKVYPGQYVYIKSTAIDLVAFEFLATYNAIEIKADNLVSILTNRPSGTLPSRVDCEWVFQIPVGAEFLAVTEKSDDSTIVKLLGQNSPYGILEQNNMAEYKPLLMNGKYRRGNDAFYTGEYENLTLLFFADIHALTVNAKRVKEFYDFYQGFYRGNSYKRLIDDMICGGDIVGAYLNKPDGSMDADGALIWWKECGLDKTLPVIGNHDAWLLDGTTKVDADEEACYNTFLAPYLDVLDIVQPTGAGTNDYYPCYYYKDYEEPDYGGTPTWNTTIRLIVLDCMHWGATQKAWLADVLDDCKENDISVIIASHYSPQLDYDFNSTFCDLDPFADTFLSDEVATLVDSSEVDFICYLCSHNHDDQFGPLVNHPNQVAITIGCASYVQDERTNRWLNAKNQDCFNIVSFDTKQKLIKIVRVGNDSDSYLRSKRVMTYNYETKEIVCNY